jgi:hypothetical protein
MPSRFETQARLAPAVWPSGTPPVQPGNLDVWAPMGHGLGAPMVLRPWDSFDSLAQHEDYYSFTPTAATPSKRRR